MIVLQRVVFAALLLAPAVLAACGGGVGGGGPRKVEISQQICASQKFIRMRLDRTHRVEIDNTLTSPGQSNIVIRFEGAPLVVDGDVPSGSVIGDPVSTIVLEAKANERASVDVIPRRLGEYRVQCSWIIQGDSNVSELRLQIVES